MVDLKEINTVDEDMECVMFDATFLDPTLQTQEDKDPIPTILGIESMYGEDTGFLLDIINWMISRHVYEKETQYDYDKQFINVSLEIDTFQINTSFKETHVEHITTILEYAVNILHTLGWTSVDYDYETAGDDEDTSNEYLDEVDPDTVEYIKINLLYQVPIRYPLND